jgi:hypothetical protein
MGDGIFNRWQDRKTFSAGTNGRGGEWIEKQVCIPETDEQTKRCVV